MPPSYDTSMLKLSLPALNNALLAAALVMPVGLAHAVFRKRNMLSKNDMQNRVHVAWGIALIRLPAVSYSNVLDLYPKPVSHCSLGTCTWVDKIKHGAQHCFCFERIVWVVYILVVRSALLQSL